MFQDENTVARDERTSVASRFMTLDLFCKMDSNPLEGDTFEKIKDVLINVSPTLGKQTEVCNQNNVAQPAYQVEPHLETGITEINLQSLGNNKKRKARSSLEIPFEGGGITKAFFKEYPETKQIKDRIYRSIKKDAAKELLKLRAVNGGKAKDGDVARIATIYNAIGFKFVTKPVLTYHLSTLEGKSIDKQIQAELRSGSKLPASNSECMVIEEGRIQGEDNNRKSDGKNRPSGGKNTFRTIEGRTYSERQLARRRLLHADDNSSNPVRCENVENTILNKSPESIFLVSTVDHQMATTEPNQNQYENSNLHTESFNSFVGLANPSGNMPQIPGLSASRSLEDQTPVQISETQDVVQNLTTDFESGSAAGVSITTWTRNNDYQPDPPLPGPRKKGGRPKGSTKDKLKPKTKLKPTRSTASKIIDDLTTQAAEITMSELARSKETGIRDFSRRHKIKLVIAELEKEHNLPAGSINEQTVLSRVLRNNPAAKKSQSVPILIEVESEIVEYCVDLVKMGLPLLQEHVIDVATSLIRKKGMENLIIEFKRKKGLYSDEYEQSLLGTKWFQGFQKRNFDTISSKSGHSVIFVKRHYYLRVEHFKAMYDLVYESMVKAGIAEKIAKPCLFDIDGGRIAHTDREWAYGLPTRYKITRPGYILHVDEIGSKTRAKKQLNFYGHVDGQMFTLPVDGQMSETGTETEVEMKFSLYCFTSGSGEAVVCAVVFMSNKDIVDIPLTVRWGIDTFKKLNEGETELELYERNCENGQAMQGGPVCNFNGKDVPCFVATSPVGFLNSQILTDICTMLDDIGVYDRSHGVLPLLLMDGHNTTLDLPFLDYVRNDNHKWMVCCGLPRDTHLLNVAASQEFNGSFKEEFNNAMQNTLYSRPEYCRQIYSSDIIPMIRYAWSLSFTRPEKAKKALALRGWNPLNYALLLHPILN